MAPSSVRRPPSARASTGSTKRRRRRSWPSVCAGSSRRSAAGMFGVSMYPKRALTWMMPSLLVAEVVDRYPLVVGQPRHRHGVDRHDDHVLVQHVVVLDVGPHRQRGGLLAAVEEHRRARTCARSGGLQSRRPSTNSRSGPSAFSLARVTISRPLCQVVITVNAMTPMSSGSHAPCTSLVRFAARNIRSTSNRNAAADQHQPQRQSPPGAGEVEEQQWW